MHSKDTIKPIKLDRKANPDHHGKNRRIEVEVKFHMLGDQEPYFSVTAAVYQPAMRARHDPDHCDSCGMLHDEISEHFPEVAHLTRWHLVSISGIPMHYVENSLYHLSRGDVEAFKHCALWGELDTDEECFICSREVLEARLPALRRKMWVEMAKAGICG